MYHLKQLMAEGLIQKNRLGKYELSTQGKTFTDKLSLKNLSPRIQPKIVTLVACKNNKGEFLLYRRNRQPFLGKIGFPYGKIHLEESILQAARRELEEKTGLSANLRHAGEVYILVYENNEVLTHMLCHIFSGKNPSGEIIINSPIGECFWEKVADPFSEKFMPGFSEVYKLVNQVDNKLFFDEFTYHIGTDSLSKKG